MTILLHPRTTVTSTEDLRYQLSGKHISIPKKSGKDAFSWKGYNTVGFAEKGSRDFGMGINIDLGVSSYFDEFKFGIGRVKTSASAFAISFNLYLTRLYIRLCHLGCFVLLSHLDTAFISHHLVLALSLNLPVCPSLSIFYSNTRLVYLLYSCGASGHWTKGRLGLAQCVCWVSFSNSANFHSTS